MSDSMRLLAQNSYFQTRWEDIVRSQPKPDYDVDEIVNSVMAKAGL